METDNATVIIGGVPSNPVASFASGEEVPSPELAQWLGATLKAKNGESFKTLHMAVKHGLPGAVLPTISGGVRGTIVGGLWTDVRNPAAAASVLDGEARASGYNLNHNGETVNPALTFDVRKSTVDLVTGLRHQCRCGVETCFVHPVERVGACGLVPNGTEDLVVTGDIAPAYNKKVSAGLVGKDAKRVPILGFRGGKVVIVEYRTIYKRSGNGAHGGYKAPAFRYQTGCTSVCGKASCWGTCSGGDTAMRFTLVNTERSGLVMAGLDPRRTHDFNRVVDALTEQVGERLVISALPFQTFGGDASN